MKRKKGFTLIELLVVIAIIAMLLAILMPALSKVKKIAMRVICGTNLKGLGTAQTVYANDNKDNWAVGAVTNTAPQWSYYTNGWQGVANVVPPGAQITVGASLYMLVRNADVGTKSFVCPASDQYEFDGKNTQNPTLDIVQLWDFGMPQTNATLTKSMGPENCVSYAYHQPYGTTGKKSTRSVDGTRGSSFAAMADKNPWYDRKISKISTGSTGSSNIDEAVGPLYPYYSDSSATSSPWVRRANSYPHGREGQNIVFADGHSAYMNTPDVGVKNDNIYTTWIAASGTNANNERQGATETGISVYAGPSYSATQNGILTTQPLSTNDSFLVNDDRRTGSTGI